MINFEGTLPKKLESLHYNAMEFTRNEIDDLVERDEEGKLLADPLQIFRDMILSIVSEIIESDSDRVCEKYTNHNELLI